MNKSPEDQILELLYTYPKTQFSFRDIERNTQLSIGTISKYVPLIQQKNLLNTDKRPTATYVSANRENPLFRQLKRANNLKKIYESNLINDLTKNLRPNCLILFGSYEKGDDTEESDIDIAVIKGRKFQINRKIFEKKLKRHLNLTYIKEPKKLKAELRTALINGIVLSGYFD